MRRLAALLLLLYFLGFSISLCVAETGVKRGARRPIAPADPPRGGTMDVLQAPITAAEVEQARRQRDVVLPKLEQLYQQPWAKEYLGALDRSLERIRPLTVAIEQAQGKLEIARARFALGQATNFDITDAQEELLDAETELLEAIVEYNTALAQLEASIAGPV